MTSTALLWGVGAFLGGWLIHFVWWRFRRPADDLRALACVLLIVPGIAGAAVWTVLGPSVPEIIMGYGVLGALSSAYITWYPAAQAASPTMLIVLQLQRAGPDGLTRDELAEALGADTLCRELVGALKAERFAVERNGRLYPGRRGMRLLRTLGALRRFIGLQEGRG